MTVSIEWHGDNFNVKLHTNEDSPEYLAIKGCKIVSGSKGEFVSWPSRKYTDNNGQEKYWNHCWASEKFNGHVLDLARKDRPQQSAPQDAFGDKADGDAPF